MKKFKRFTTPKGAYNVLNKWYQSKQIIELECVNLDTGELVAIPYALFLEQLNKGLVAILY